MKLVKTVAVLSVAFAASSAFAANPASCKPPPTFALCCSNFCTLGFAKVSTAFALYRMMRNKKSDATVAFYFTNYIRPILH